jgi:hypothetical protein
MVLYNLLENDVVVFDSDKSTVTKTYSPHGYIALLDMTPQEPREPIDGVPTVNAPSFGGPHKPLPDLADCEGIIVPLPLGQYIAANRSAFAKWGRIVSPDVRAGGVRAPDGKLLGTTRFMEW